MFPKEVDRLVSLLGKESSEADELLRRERIRDDLTDCVHRVTDEANNG